MNSVGSTRHERPRLGLQKSHKFQSQYGGLIFRALLDGKLLLGAFVGKDIEPGLSLFVELQLEQFPGSRGSQATADGLKTLIQNGCNMGVSHVEIVAHSRSGKHGGVVAQIGCARRGWPTSLASATRRVSHLA
jgi:hypothetical protein